MTLGIPRGPMTPEEQEELAAALEEAAARVRERAPFAANYSRSDDVQPVPTGLFSYVTNNYGPSARSFHIVWST